jgi:hypothetical protein
MDRQELETTLSETFGDDPAVSIVARQAGDLADSGQFNTNFGGTVTVETVVDNLQDAPESHTLVERWNWWLGSLDLSHGGYTRFSVREDIDTQA